MYLLPIEYITVSTLHAVVSFLVRWQIGETESNAQASPRAFCLIQKSTMTQGMKVLKAESIF